jgi:hypothetical protein
MDSCRRAAMAALPEHAAAAAVCRSRPLGVFRVLPARGTHSRGRSDIL